MSRKVHARAIAATVLAASLLAAGAPALAQTVYSGTGGAAATAAADFAGAIGLSTLETFDGRTDGELAPSWSYAGGTATLDSGFGVTSTYAYGGGAVSGTKGYGAYPNGGIGGNPVFSFTSALSAFGAYFVDLELTNSLTFSFSNGGIQTYDLPIAGEGGVAFFGVNFGTNTITGVNFNLGPDEAILIDDVRVATTAVPEPSVWALLIAGFGLAGSALRSRRRVAVRA